LGLGRGFGLGWLLRALPWLDRLGGLRLGLGGLGLTRVDDESIPVSIRVGVVALVAAFPRGG
jgi:hypothetical protein